MLKYLLILMAVLLAAAIWFRATADAASLILFDEGHGQRFVVAGEGALDLSTLGGVLREQGSDLRRHAGPLTDAALAGVAGLVISGPFAPVSAEEIAVIRRFVEGGGALAVMLHIGPPLAGLLHEFGVDFSNGTIRESEGVIGDEPLNFQVSRLEEHPLFQGMERFSLYGGWALVSFDERSRVIASTGPKAWVDLNGDRKPSAGDATQSFGVAVAGQLGAGRFVVFGDDGLFQNRFIDADNRKLAANLGRWLTE